MTWSFRASSLLLKMPLMAGVTILVSVTKVIYRRLQGAGRCLTLPLWANFQHEDTIESIRLATFVFKSPYATFAEIFSWSKLFTLEELPMHELSLHMCLYQKGSERYQWRLWIFSWLHLSCTCVWPQTQRRFSSMIILTVSSVREIFNILDSLFYLTATLCLKIKTCCAETLEPIHRLPCRGLVPFLCTGGRAEGFICTSLNQVILQKDSSTFMNRG